MNRLDPARPLDPGRPGATQPQHPDSRRAEDPVDRAIVARIQRGDSSAWNELLSRYQHRIYSVCFRLVNSRQAAEDLAQDAMVRVIEGIGRFDGRASVSTWIYRVTVNSCLTRLRSEKYRRHERLDASNKRRTPEPGSTAPAEQGPLSRVQRGDRRERLLAALDRIEHEQRAILILRDVQGLDYDQVGQVLDVPVGTVKSRLFRARAALRRAMEDLGEPSDGGEV